MSVSRPDIRLSRAQTYLCIVFPFSRLLDKCHYNQQFSCPFSPCFYKYLKPNPSFPAGTECTTGYRIKKNHQDFESIKEKLGEKFLLAVNPTSAHCAPCVPQTCSCPRWGAEGRPFPFPWRRSSAAPDLQHCAPQLVPAHRDKRWAKVGNERVIRPSVPFLC